MFVPGADPTYACGDKCMCTQCVSVCVRNVKVRQVRTKAMRPRGPGPLCAWAWLVLAALGGSTAYTDTEEFLSDLDKPGKFVC